jgi:nicotinamidase-related amidase
MYKTALVMVDVQRDFLPGGALGIEGGDQIIFPLIRAARSCDLVIASADRHEANDNSFTEQGGPWPPHCVQGTKGQQIHPKIRKLANYTISKGMDPDGPDDYSAFTGHTLRPVHTLAELLKQHGITQVVVGGLALNYCVKFTAFDANALGYRTIVPLDCTRSLTTAAIDPTLEAFDRAGVLHPDTWSDA